MYDQLLNGGGHRAKGATTGPRGRRVPDKRRCGLATRRLAWLAAAAVALCACGSSAGGAATSTRTRASSSPQTSVSSSASTASTASTEGAGSPLWQLKWQTDFPDAAPLGAFSDCDNNDRTPTAYCGGLPASLRSQWWAYPTGWPDSATEVHMPLGGYYDPGHAVWISGGQMHIRMFRTTGSIHSAAVVPKASIGLLYGKYVARFRVLDTGSGTGYKSSYLLWPTGNLIKYEVDFPEGSWDNGFCVHVHAVSEGSATENFCPVHDTWGSWNTTAVEWWPGNVAFYLNGTQIYHVTGKWVPDERMSWIIQNESALNGEVAPENSSAQLNISYVAVYTYGGEKS
jgi:hypothetical protein